MARRKAPAVNTRAASRNAAVETRPAQGGLWRQFRQGGRYYKHLKYGLIVVAFGYMATRVIAVLGPEDDFKQQLRLKDAIANSFEADAEKAEPQRCAPDLDRRIVAIRGEASEANRQPVQQYADEFMNKACKRGVAWGG